MSLTRAYEERDIAPDVRRVYDDVRASFDLPFVPTIFKVAAGLPEYLKLMWRDLGPVVRSREFQSAAGALEEFVYWQALHAAWRFSDQQRQLAAQRFSRYDIDQLGAVVATFSRALPRMVLFARIMQRGYSGGQSGRCSGDKQASALSRMMTLHIPNERDASLRVWLIYSDIKKTTTARQVPSLFRALAPFPGYLASLWMDAKKVFRQPEFEAVSQEVSKRSLSLLVGLPVRDHRAVGRQITPAQWKAIEELVDNNARLLPSFAVLASVWYRSFPPSMRMLAA
ncbi:MAG TPA: halocarboxylic acid dehydrogenase DehI family protein [Terriglobales bacterium]|nr:halocarboxylic acid dehydrogenase DehI family protein [Terriglobales bacterium]